MYANNDAMYYQVCIPIWLNDVKEITEDEPFIGVL